MSAPKWTLGQKGFPPATIHLTSISDTSYSINLGHSTLISS